jgi:hypothetical protein
LGLPPPDSEPSFCHFLVFVLVVVQAILWLGLAGALLVWLLERNTQLLLDSAIRDDSGPVVHPGKLDGLGAH